MNTVNQLVDFARAQGAAFANGKDATSTGFESARIKAIIPAIKAIESDAIVFDDKMARLITEAYNEGAGGIYKDGTLSSAVSKTAGFLIAASHKVCMPIINAVQEVIRTTNDSEIQKSMSKGMFEKLNKLMVTAKLSKAVPDRDALVAVLYPNVEALKEELLAAALKKSAKLLKEINALDSSVFAALANTSLEHERLSGEYVAKAKRIREKMAKGDGVVTPVTLQSNAETITEGVDELDIHLAA